MGSVCMAERKSRRCRIKVKTQRADRFPCQRQTGVFLEQALSRNIPAWKGIYCQQQLEISFQPVSQV